MYNCGVIIFLINKLFKFTRMIIDCHTHNGEFGGKYRTPEELITSMDEAGIDISFLFANLHSGRGLSTKHVVEIAKQYPRLKAVGNITYATLDKEQIGTITQHAKNKEIIAVKFYLGYEAFYPTDEKLFPIYEMCIASDMPVIFHTGILESSFNGLMKHSHPLNIDEVAGLFPDLKIMIAHMGNPWLMDCAAVVAKNKNVYVDCSGYFKEYSPIEPEEESMFKNQLTQFRVFVGDFKKMLFGTDWPIYSQKEYLKAVQSLPMTEEERELVFYKNAQNLFHI